MTVDPARRVQVELLPIAALLRAGHQLRVALGGHDAACFDRYGPPTKPSPSTSATTPPSTCRSWLPKSYPDYYVG